ncbi:Multi antimicrobial extrusion protein like protein [Aduncisulcus paluster]|uniref:Multi antimicrobial extrusion protein like protein n=1 Tax=Aduncisulcus paluster TaxID=2918883 RepID=A0ABQ5K657_9EUKA|nr:Multi antimicrobial extrusion protein like protein [Aduncisulcus paluster]
MPKGELKEIRNPSIETIDDEFINLSSEELEQLGSSSIFKLIFNISFSSVVSFVAMTAYENIDSMAIGTFAGSSALSGVSAFLYFEYFIVTDICYSFGGAATGVISHALGSQNFLRARKVLLYIVFGCIIWGILVPLICVPILPWLLPTIGVPDAAYEETHEYAVVILLGTCFPLLVVSLSQLFRAENRPYTAMWIELSCALLNCGGDFLTMGAWNMGPRGAALSTVGSNVILLIVIIIIHCSCGQFGEKIRPQVNLLNKEVFSSPFDKEAFGKTFGGGVAFLLLNSLLTLGIMFSIANISNYSSDEETLWVAAFGVSGRLATLVFGPCGGIGAALPAIMGYNLGRKNFDRVFQALWKGALSITVFASFLGILNIVFLHQIAGLFSDGNDDLTSLIEQISIWVPFTTFICAGIHTITGILQAERNVVGQLILFISNGIPMIVVAYLLPAIFGIDGFKFIYFVGYGLPQLICAILLPRWMFKYHNLKNIEVIDLEDSDDIDPKMSCILP